MGTLVEESWLKLGEDHSEEVTFISLLQALPAAYLRARHALQFGSLGHALLDKAFQEAKQAIF